MAGVMEFPQPLNSIILTVVLIIVGAANYGGVAAQSPGCAATMATLSPCIGYITSNVATSPPPQSCCTALSSIVQTSAVCICQLLIANPFGIPINQTQALALPGACKISTPALTRCKVADAPAPSPVTGVPAPSPVTGSSHPVQPPTVSVPSPSPSPAPPASVPNAESPTSKSPSFLPPTTSVGGITPAGRKGPTSNAGALFSPSIIISILAGVVVLSAMS